MRATTLLLLCAACGGGGAVARETTPAPSATPSATVCADAPREVYQPQPAWSGRAAAIPDPPALPTSPQRIGDAYTVYGALHALHSIDAPTKLAGEITVVGYVVDTNLARAPKCVIHKTGRGDPPGCVSEIPAFTIADDKAATAGAPRIRAMGWASNFANVYEAYLKERARDATSYVDEFWAVELPRPLPAPGAKVKVVGRYGALFTRSSGGIESDPHNGILTVTRVETLERAPAPARFPQLGH